MRVLRNTNLMLVGIVVLFAVGILASPSYARIDPGTIVGMWLFEEDNEDETVIDSSGNGHDGTIFGPPERDDGKLGSALNVGASNYVRVPHAEDLSLKSYTVTAWLSTEDSIRWICVISKTHDESTRNYLMVWQKGTNKPGMCIGDEAGNTWHSLYATTVVNDGEWHHVAISFDDDKNVGKVFVDGVQEAQYNVTNEVPLNEADLVFASHTGGNNLYIGLLDEIAIFNIALEEEDIQVIMNEGLEKAIGITAVSPAGKLTTWAGVKAQD